MHNSAAFLLFTAALGAAAYIPGERTPLSHRLNQRQATPLASQQYDYIIVGGGTAGLVMANRLSEDPSITVAVIEAGGFYEQVDPILSTTPALDNDGSGSDPSSTNAIDWNFVTSPQKGLNNRQIHYARGKCLGGSSARNFMIYQRGTRDSYDQWAQTVGDSSYSFDNFLPYFKKSVQFTPPDSLKRFPNASADYNPAAFSSSGGPLQVSYPNYAEPWSTWGQRAMNEIGIRTRRDFNSGNILGSQYCSTTISPAHELRDSSESSFLRAAAARPNLHVFNNTLVKKIIFSGNTATGVSVEAGGVKTELRVRGEVIVSAGAFQSPQILMVSGIGPERTLRKFNIPCVVDLPGVGKGMQDHIFFGPSYRVNVQTDTIFATDPTFVPRELAGEYQLGLGPLTNNGADFIGFEKLPSAFRKGFSGETKDALDQYPPDWPEVELFASPGFTGNFSNLETNQPTDGFQYATFLAALIAPASRGSVTISSSDTADLPIINPGWLTSEVDQEVAIAAFKRARAAFAAKSIKPVLIGGEYYPGPKVSTDAQILDWIRNNAMTVWHASCTCAMGDAHDPHAVVDSHARVFGVNNVRVVDASIFPFLPPGHPQSTIYALAEKISDLIKQGG